MEGRPLARAPEPPPALCLVRARDIDASAALAAEAAADLRAARAEAELAGRRAAVPLLARLRSAAAAADAERRAAVAAAAAAAQVSSEPILTGNHRAQWFDRLQWARSYVGAILALAQRGHARGRHCAGAQALLFAYSAGAVPAQLLTHCVLRLETGRINMVCAGAAGGMSDTTVDALWHGTVQAFAAAQLAGSERAAEREAEHAAALAEATAHWEARLAAEEDRLAGAEAAAAAAAAAAELGAHAAAGEAARAAAAAAAAADARMAEAAARAAAASAARRRGERERDEVGTLTRGHELADGRHSLGCKLSYQSHCQPWHMQARSAS